MLPISKRLRRRSGRWSGGDVRCDLDFFSLLAAAEFRIAVNV